LAVIKGGKIFYSLKYSKESAGDISRLGGILAVH